MRHIVVLIIQHTHCTAVHIVVCAHMITQVHRKKTRTIYEVWDTSYSAFGKARKSFALSPLASLNSVAITLCEVRLETAWLLIEHLYYINMATGEYWLKPNKPRNQVTKSQCSKSAQVL
jgi:hypothetical protein